MLAKCYLNPFPSSVIFHIDTSHLTFSANQMTGFYMKWTLDWNALTLTTINIFINLSFFTISILPYNHQKPNSITNIIIIIMITIIIINVFIIIIVFIIINIVDIVYYVQTNISFMNSDIAIKFYYCFII